MTWEMFWRLSTFFPPGTDLDPMSLAIGAFGTPTLVIVAATGLLVLFHIQGDGSESHDSGDSPGVLDRLQAGQ